MTVVTSNQLTSAETCGSGRGAAPNQWATARGALREADDAQLVAHLLANRRGAWVEFARRFDAPLARAIDSVLRRFPYLRARLEPEEIQAALYCALLEDDMRKLRHFDVTRGSLIGFVRMLAAREAWNHVRVASREPRTAPLAISDTIAAPDREVTELLIEREQGLGVLGALASLPERDRQFAELFFVERRPLPEVATCMGISVATVYSKKHKLQNRLRKVRRHLVGRPRARRAP